MLTPLPNLKILVTKTATGEHDYVQITSEDQFGLNIVLISGKIEIDDRRTRSKVKAADRIQRRR